MKSLGNIWMLFSLHFQMYVKKSMNYGIQSETDFYKSKKTCRRNDFTDITLKSKTKSIKAHKIILAEASPIFGKMMKEHHSKVLQLKDLSMEHLTEILNFIYDGEISTDKLKLHIKFLLKAAIDVIVEL
jgi:hypothetical protein